MKSVVHIRNTPPPGPRSFNSAFTYEGPAGEVASYRTPGRCQVQVPGFTETPPGSRVSLAWVDASGRVGAQSKPVVVTKGKSAAGISP